MGYTNKTSHYDLPQWIAGDKPSWLGDVNTAMLNIDTAIAGADASATAAESSAAAANAQVQVQEAKITKNTTDIQALTENLADTQGEVNNVKTTAEGALPKSGGTMTGNLILNAAPTSDLQAATKKYVDEKRLDGTSFTLGEGAQSAGYFINGWVVNGYACIQGVGNLQENLTDGAILLTCPGNPLNLTVNTRTTVGSVLEITSANINKTSNLSAKFDGTKTDIYVTGSKASGSDLFVLGAYKGV